MRISRPYAPRRLARDAAIGVIIALVSIPISMGYAQVAGLPVERGLYGSLLPILCFGLLTSSPRFVFGVDAAPAALVGGMVASLGIAPESAGAAALIPAVSLLVAVWLAAFYVLHADRVLKFISQPVMGGFITGIGMTIICMQVPKLFGGAAGTGELPELLAHIWREGRREFHPLSFALGAGTVALVLAGRRLCPRLPVQPLLMFAGAALTYFFHIDRLGVRTLPAVAPGLPRLSLPDVLALGGRLGGVLLPSASIAVVILSETLLASSNIARKRGDVLLTRREIAAYAVGNAAAAVSGCCPVNGSVSRTGIADQLGVTSQAMSVAAALTMGLILLFGTGFIGCLPVPVLTGIVISALIGTFEFSLAHRLRRVDTAEFVIFYAAFAAVLLLGTIYGVIVGVLLAAVTFIIRQAKPSVDFLGIVPGMEGYYSLTRPGTAAVPIRGAVVYRFSGPLFYANVGQCCADVEEAARRGGTRAVVIDSGGISSVDATAAEWLLALWRSLAERGVRLYLAGHVSRVNDQLRAFGAQELILRRAVRPAVSAALRDAGFVPPYPLERGAAPAKAYGPRLAEFEWAFGTQAERVMADMADRLARDIMDEVARTGTFDVAALRRKERQFSQGYWDEADEDEFLDVLAMRVDMALDGQASPGGGAGVAVGEVIARKILARHAQLEQDLLQNDVDAVEKIIRRRLQRDRYFRHRYPRVWEQLEVERERYFAEIAMERPELARKLADIIAREEEGGGR